MMTGITITTFDNPETGVTDVWYETMTFGQPVRHRGDVGLEHILERIPVEAFRRSWRLEIVKARDLMLGLPKAFTYNLDILFDIGHGFYFQFLEPICYHLVGPFKAASEAIAFMAPTIEESSLEDLSDRDESELFEIVEITGDEGPTHDEPEPSVSSELDGRFQLADQLAKETTKTIRLCLSDCVLAFDFKKNALRWPTPEELQMLSQKYAAELFNQITLDPSSGALSIVGIDHVVPSAIQ